MAIEFSRWGLKETVEIVGVVLSLLLAGGWAGRSGAHRKQETTSKANQPKKG